VCVWVGWCGHQDLNRGEASGEGIPRTWYSRQVDNHTKRGQRSWMHRGLSIAILNVTESDLAERSLAILFVTGLLMPAHRSERKRIGRTSQEVSEDDLQECVTYSDGPRAPVFRSSNILGMSGELYLCLCVLLCAQPCTSCNGNCALINPDAVDRKVVLNAHSLKFKS
jgi:hypothetical protein